MKTTRDYIPCNRCGAGLSGAICQYCGKESNFIFMGIADFVKMCHDVDRFHPGFISQIKSPQIVYYSGKEIVLEI
jgi:hypothetical protein